MDNIILIPILTAIGLLIWGDNIKENHPILSFMFQLAYLPLIFATMELAIIDATLVYSSNAELVTTITDITYIIGILMLLVGIYYMITFLLWAKNYMLQKRNEKLEIKYGDNNE